MRKNNAWYLVIFLSGFCVLFLFISLFLWMDMSSQLQAYASYAGIMQASFDFQNRKYILYEIKTIDKGVSFDPNEPFEIKSYPSSFFAFGRNSYIKAYNTQMKTLFNQQIEDNQSD